MDFYLWRYPKSRVYAFNLYTVSDLNDTIRSKFQLISLDIVRVSKQSTINRMKRVIEGEGGYEENL